MNDIKTQTNIDKGLVSMFLKLSAEERLSVNDNTVRSILELKDAFQKNKTRRRWAKLTPLKVKKCQR